MAGQLWAVNSLGGFYYSLNLSKDLRDGVKATSKFRQFADIRDAWGKVTRSGQTFTWDTIPMMSRASRALTETNTIPQGAHTILQGTLTMNERGFAVPYTELLDNLSAFSVRQPIMDVLKYDARVDLDCLAWQQFNATPLRAAATATGDPITLVTTGTCTTTNSAGISTTNIKSIVDTMKSRNIPTYRGDDYYAIGRPKGMRVFKNALETLHQYTESGMTMIMNGEIGRYENCRFVEQTTVPAGGAGPSPATFDPFTDTAQVWTNSTATEAGDWMFFFGKDTLCEAIHTAEEIRSKVADDYGRSRGIAWYALLGYGLCHTNATQARVVKWDSAV